MNEALRRLYVTSLMEGIATVGPAFERFGGIFLDHHVPERLLHPGLNAFGHPVGYTVDSSSETGTTVAEYSAEMDYFTDTPKTKIRRDIRHVLKKNPSGRNIYFLSAQVCGPARRTELTRLAAAFDRLRRKKIRFYDAREIAEIIVDEMLGDDTAIEKLSAFLPQLSRISDENSVSNMIPTIGPDYLARPAVNRELVRRLQNARLAVVAGHGGSGKTQVCAAVAAELRDKFDLVVWIDGSSIQALEDLYAIDVARRGIKQNVPTLLRDRRCLLVLDDLTIDIDLEALLGLCGPWSAILISRLHAKSNDFVVPPLDQSEAAQMLGLGGVVSCPADVFDLIWQTVGGHPLTLRLINAAVREESLAWPEVGEDCRGIVELDDARRVTVANRVLGRLLPGLRQQLWLFLWRGATTCDGGFARNALGTVQINKLRRYCLVNGGVSHSVKLHDVVFAAARSVVGDPPSEVQSGFAGQLAKYVGEILYTKDIEAVALAHGMRDLFERLIRSGAESDGFLYCLLQATPPEALDDALIGDIMQRATALAENANPPSNVAVGVVLEAIEALYRQAKALRGIAAAKRELETRLEVFDVLAGIAGLSPRSTAEIAHHRGKALNILYRRQEAEAAFDAVLSGPVPLYEARLQLLRIYARDKTRSSEAFTMLEAILGDAVTTGGDVSTSVVLAAAETLSWPGLKDAQDKVLVRYNDLFEERILSSAATGSEHVYQAFASVGRRWVWDDPDRFVRVWAALPPKEPLTMETDQSRFAWGDTLRDAAVRLCVDSARKNTLQAEALACFEAMRERSPYHERKMGQLLIEMERWDVAIAMLEGVNEASQEPWRSYWLSKASLGRGALAIALDYVESALAKLDANSSYWSTFMQQRFDVRVALGHTDALEDLRMAHDACKDAKFKALLAARLQAATLTV